LDRVESEVDGIANETHCGRRRTQTGPVKKGKGIEKGTQVRVWDKGGEKQRKKDVERKEEKVGKGAESERAEKRDCGHVTPAPCSHEASCVKVGGAPADQLQVVKKKLQISRSSLSTTQYRYFGGNTGPGFDSLIIYLRSAICPAASHDGR
jgi:hypothetical protein